MNQRRSLTDQALFLLGGRITSFALTFVLPLILARLFSKHDFGLYRKFSVFFMAIFIIAQFGLSYSLPSLLPRFPDKAKAILANTVFVQTAICALLLGAGVWIHFAGLSWGWPEDFVKIALPLSAFAGFMVAASPFDQVLVIEERGQAAGLLLVLYDLTRGLFLLLAALLLRDMIMVLWGVTLAAVLRFVAMVLYLRRRYQLSANQLSRPVFWDQLKLAGPMAVQSSAHLLESHVDKYLIIYFYSTTIYAVYSVGAFQIPIVEMLFHSIAAVILPRLATHYREQDTEKLLALWNDAIRKSAILLFPMFALLFTVHREFLLFLFSHKYTSSVPIFAVYLWIIPTYIMANNLLLQAIGHSKYLFWTGIYKPMLAVLMVVAGLHWGGLLGAAAGLVLYHYVATYLYALLTARALGVTLSQLVPVRALAQIVLLMLGAGLFTVAVTFWISLSLFFQLAIRSSVFVLVAGVLLFRSSVLTSEDRATARHLLTRIVNRLRRQPASTPSEP